MTIGNTVYIGDNDDDDNDVDILSNDRVFIVLQHPLSYDQLRAAALIGRNAIT